MTLFRRAIFLFIGLLPLNSCFWGDENSEKNIVGNYWAMTMDGGSKYYLHYANEIEYGAPLIDSEVTEAGHNKRVIVIKSCAYYYIVPLERINYSKRDNGEYHDVRQEIRRKVLGPFTKAEFNQNMAAIGEDSLMIFDQQLADCQ